MFKKAFNYLILAIIVYLIAGATAYATPTLSLEVEGGYYDSVTETWMSNDSNFTLKLIASETGGEEELFGVNLVISVLGTESEMENGSVSLDGGDTTISSSSFSFGTPQFSQAKTGTQEYPSHGIYDSWFATYEINDGDEIELPQTFTYEVVITGFSWVHFDAFGYYEVASGKKGKKIRSEFVPPSHDAEYVAEAMAVPEPSTFALMAIALLMLVFLRNESLRKRIQAVKIFIKNRKR